MKIVLISMNFAPELTGIGKYSGEMAEALVGRGHEVKVVCAPPYYPTWRVHEGHTSHAYRVERPSPGLTLYRCPIWIPVHLGSVSRLLHLVSFALATLPVLFGLAFWRPGIVFVVAPALPCAPFGWLMARLSGARAWLHVQDFEIDAAFELGLLRRPILRRAALLAERVLMRRFDAVSTISRRMMRQLATKGISLQETELVPNWVDLSLVRPTLPSYDLRERLGIKPQDVVCLFSGTINRKQGLDVLVGAARRLQDIAPQIVLVICGNGEMRPALEESARGLGSVRFIDLQPAAELNHLLNMADIHLLPQLRGAADLVMPSKLAGMLASGRPVIAAAIPGTEIGTILATCGVIVEPECAQDFAEAIYALAADPERRNALGHEARRHAERMLDSNKIIDRLSARLEALVRANRELPAPGHVAATTVRMRS